MSFTFNTISPSAQSSELGVIFPKGATIAAADFDKDLGLIDAAIFVPNEVWGAFMVVEAIVQPYNVEITLKNGTNKILTVPPWVWMPIQGTQIVSAGTTATLVTIAAGQ